MELDGPFFRLETQSEGIICELGHGGDGELLVRSVLNLVGSLFSVHDVIIVS